MNLMGMVRVPLKVEGATSVHKFYVVPDFFEEMTLG